MFLVVYFITALIYRFVFWPREVESMALTLTIPCRCWHGRVKSSLPSASGEGCQYPSQAVRALPIRIITVGKKRSPGVQLLVDDYIGKLKHYCHVDDVVIRSNPKNTQDVRAQVDDEDGAIMNLIGSDDWVVMLDERGLDMGSEQLAGLVGNAGNTGASRLSFCIGGPYGLGRQVRERADISIKLSSMVLNHQIALVVLMEQLYSTEQLSSVDECGHRRKTCQGSCPFDELLRGFCWS